MIIRTIKYLIFSILLIFSAQNIYGQKKSRIKILGAKKTTVQRTPEGELRIMRGNVRFKYNKMLMFCDSAVLMAGSSDMNAYGNVKVEEKAKDLVMTGDSLIFNGGKKEGKLRGSVLVVTKDQQLRTRFLNFNTRTNIITYFNGGVITSRKDSSILKSQTGYYYTKKKTYFFKDSVSYITDDYKIYSDTMEYNLEEDKVYFHGKTDMYSDSNHIFCEKGWYDQKSELSSFSINVRIENPEQLMFGDSVFFDQNKNQGEAFGNVEIIDTTNKIEVLGDYAKYDNKKGNSLVTGNLELVLQFSKDTLHLHSDTLITTQNQQTKQRNIQAFHHVQFFKPDLQGKCDSLSFTEGDSTMRMYINPVVWTDSNQVTGEEIIIKTYDGIIDNMQINKDAFIISQEDENAYNQIKGKSLYAHFTKNEIRKIDVNRSGQTIYYVREEDGSLMGMNRLDCSKMSIYIDSLGIDHIKFYNQPDGTFYPLKKVTPELKFLRYFYWRLDEKPNTKDEIFHWTEVPEYVRLKRNSPVTIR